MANTQDLPWWKKTAVYQIYPRSFKDSTNNGIGDIQGIISRLDYIKDLGIETIWLSPFFKSPQRDFGYDVSDYLSIAQEYGDMADCDQLIDEIHRHEMKIVLDLVLNHTSDQHPWFLESRSSLDNPKRDWYIWKDGKGDDGMKPPNNWQSMTTGSGWHYDNTTNQYYWAAFLEFQPDLNYRNPEVKKAMFDVMRFWLEKGVDGFRLDILGSVYEDEEFRDNPRNWQLLPSNDERGMLFRSSEMTINHKDNYKFVKELRELVDSYNPPRYMVGEVFGRYPQMVKFCGGEDNDGLHSVFLFETMETKLSKSGYTKLIKNFERNFQEPLIPTWTYSNHDRFRSIHKLGNNVDKAKLQAGLQLTMRGVPYIYYGEELGMHQVKFPFKDSLDELSYKFKKYPSVITNILMRLTDGAIDRDGCRTPMQWDTSLNAGFSRDESGTWLPIHDNYETINVETQIADPASLVNTYRRFIEFRKENDCLNKGSIKIISNPEDKDVLVYSRFCKKTKSENLTLYANFSGTPKSINIGEGEVLISTSYVRQEKIDKGESKINKLLFLLAYELVVLKLTN